jgi:hypothetical protein
MCICVWLYFTYTCAMCIHIMCICVCFYFAYACAMCIHITCICVCLYLRMLVQCASTICAFVCACTLRMLAQCASTICAFVCVVINVCLCNVHPHVYLCVLVFYVCLRNVHPHFMYLHSVHICSPSACAHLLTMQMCTSAHKACILNTCILNTCIVTLGSSSAALSPVLLSKSYKRTISYTK